jgi:DHA1 family multidrug resistance protein-like MFS transporter
MSKRQLWSLFICGLIPYTVGNGLLPLLPIYAIQLGADSVLAGYYVSVAYFALAIGTFLAGWLSDKLQHRKVMLFSAGIVMTPLIFLMGYVTNIWHLVGVTAGVWFVGGIEIALVNILTGLFAKEEERGKIFGIIGSTMALGAVIGGLVIGPMVDRWGYPMMFLVICLFSTIFPISALFLKDKTVVHPQKNKSSIQRQDSKLDRVFVLLLIAHLLSSVIIAIGYIGRSLAMDNIGFSSTAITSTAVIGGFVLLPFPLLIGWLSDKLGRKLLMILSYLCFALCTVLFIFSKSLWHFWVATSVLTIGTVSSSVGPAFVTDLVPQERLGMGISLFQVMIWIGMVVGFAVSGYSIRNLGISNTFIWGAILPIISIILIALMRKKERIDSIT